SIHRMLIWSALRILDRRWSMTYLTFTFLMVSIFLSPDFRVVCFLSSTSDHRFAASGDKSATPAMFATSGCINAGQQNREPNVFARTPLIGRGPRWPAGSPVLV